jgi:hypothetical protein
MEGYGGPAQPSLPSVSIDGGPLEVELQIATSPRESLPLNAIRMQQGALCPRVHMERCQIMLNNGRIRMKKVSASCSQRAEAKSGALRGEFKRTKKAPAEAGA